LVLFSKKNCFLSSSMRQTAGRPMPNTQALLQQIQALPPERIAEIEDFVAFIAAREQELSFVRAAAAASAPAFAAAWDSPDNDIYSAL
jgi:hypothetical protein